MSSFCTDNINDYHYWNCMMNTNDNDTEINKIEGLVS